ncbi:retrotransposon protein, putative, ty1-copia subclass [Tanacetum coccineum]
MRIVLRNEQKLHHLEEALPEAPPAIAIAVVRNAYTRKVAKQQEVACLMLVSMTPEIQKNLEDRIAFEILHELKTMFQQQAKQELFETVKAFHACKQEEGQSISTYMLKMKAYLDQMDNKKTKRNLDSTFLWHCRLGHINKKRIVKLKHDGLLESIDDESFDVCVSCISGKMERKPFTHVSERVDDLLGIIHSYVCGPFRTMSREGDHGEPPNYRATLSNLESKKWLEAMNVEMQSMKDNQVWNLVDLPPNCKTVGSKWLFKKKTDMDGNIHTYKARLVAKGFTQTYGVDYEETFSPVADIKAIRILIAIAAYYDYEIWQMDVKTAFLNGRLNGDIYMVQPEGFVNLKHPRRVCKLQRSIYGLKQAFRS